MEYSIAHQQDVINWGQTMLPDGRVPWRNAQPPDITKGEEYWTGRLRTCSYCGSMHPHDVAAAIQAGATGSWADMKYGWPHKAYFTNIPNPHVALLEIRSSANFLPDNHKDWIQTIDGHWHEPGQPASETTQGKFYIVHLKDATQLEKAAIEAHLGICFEFTDGGAVVWRRII